MHLPYIDEFPAHTHAWAQTDRYALAKGFVDNNLDFFHPQTYVLNKQFPGGFMIADTSRITAVDFPVHDYIPAIFMKITNNEKPFIFRLYVFLIGVIGLLYLFKTALILTRSYFKAWLTLIFASTSPVFVYYHSGMLPTIPSLAIAIIGIYQYLIYIQKDKIHFLWRSIVFLTVAALGRTTFVIPIVAIFMVEVLRSLRKDVALKKIILPFILPIICIGSYKLHNNALRTEYGAMFLNKLLPPDNVYDAFELIKMTVQNWWNQYLSVIHYFLLLLVLLLVVLRYKKIKRGQNRFNYWLLTGLLFCGNFLFLMAMMKQFPDHDYYFLDTFYLPLIIFFILLLASLEIGKIQNRTWIKGIAAVVLLAILMYNAKQVQSTRRTPEDWNRTYTTYSNFKESKSFLKSLNIPKGARMLVVDAYAPNLALTLMDRTGFSIMSTSERNLKNMFDWNFDYLVFQKQFFSSDVYSVYPDILNRLKKVGDNGKIILCKDTANVNDQTLISFLGLNDQIPLFEGYVNYEDSIYPLWTQTESRFYSSLMGKVGVLETTDDYGLTFKSKSYAEFFETPRMVLFSAEIMINHPGDLHLVVSLDAEGENFYFETRQINSLVDEKEGWKSVDLFFQLPSVTKKDLIFGLFFWNTGSASALYDEVTFKVY